jgi:hypothetical protein
MKLIDKLLQLIEQNELGRVFSVLKLAIQNDEEKELLSVLKWEFNRHNQIKDRYNIEIKDNAEKTMKDFVYRFVVFVNRHLEDKFNLMDQRVVEQLVDPKKPILLELRKGVIQIVAPQD